MWRPDLPLSAELNGRSHRQLDRMSHSNPIITALKRMTAFVPDDFVKEAPDWAIRGYREHESIMSAFLAGEEQKLHQMITHHVMSVGDHLVEVLSHHRQEEISDNRSQTDYPNRRHSARMPDHVINQPHLSIRSTSGPDGGRRQDLRGG